MHFDLGYAITLAGFASTAFYVKTKSTRLVTARPGFLGTGKNLSNRGEQAGIGGRIRTRCAANWALVDIDNLVEVFEAAEGLVLSGI